MSSKKWLIAFFGTLLLLIAGLAALNYFTDPFGVFAGPGLQWPSYEMTINPRTAKLTYLKDHHQEFDSYIIGGSSTSSYPTQRLDQYFDAHFYNMIMYGSDMLDVSQMVRYLADHYTVKHLVISMFIESALYYDTMPDPLSYDILPEVTGADPAAFYAKYLFADPRHALDKWQALREDADLPRAFDVFDGETGAYDKRGRDAEFLGSMDRYLEGYPVFANYPEAHLTIDWSIADASLARLADIRDLCRERGIDLVVVNNPVYADHMAYFDWDEVSEFYTRMAQVTPYWDFSYSSVSFDPRYFYDETHFRNCVGEMALARMFGDGSVYVPDDFGAYVTAETAAEHFAAVRDAAPLPEEAYTAHVPVLLYHSLDPGSDPAAPERFRAHMEALTEAGYNFVALDQVRAYVREGGALPDKPVLLTFDDGYLDNYLYAFPVLKELEIPAVIFTIAGGVGQTEHYKDTEFPITPRFSYDQAAEMVSSGLVTIQSHTWDMHQWAPFESGHARENILRWEDESEEDYRAVLAEDCRRARAALEAGTGQPVHALAYPSGLSDDLAQAILSENGYDMTFTTQWETATLVRGLPQSLLGIPRYSVGSETTVEELLALVSDARRGA